VNARALVIFALSLAHHVPGFLAKAGVVAAADVPAIFHACSTYAWLLGFSPALGLYAAFGMPRAMRPGCPAAEVSD
jgi:hypothetical protein